MERHKYLKKRKKKNIVNSESRIGECFWTFLNVSVNCNIYNKNVEWLIKLQPHFSIKIIYVSPYDQKGKLSKNFSFIIYNLISQFISIIFLEFPL